MRARGGTLDALIVHDERRVREAIADLLSQAGLRVDVSENVLRAIRILERSRARVVITDDRMPGPAGLMLLEAVERRWPETARVLLLTEKLDRGGELRARACGATVFLRSALQEEFRSAIVRLAHERR